MQIEPIHFLFTYCYEDFYPPKKARGGTAQGGFPWHHLVGWLLVIAAGILVVTLFSTQPEKPPVRARVSGRQDWVTIAIGAIVVGALFYSYLRQRLGGKARWEEKHPQSPIAVTLSSEGIVWEHSTSHTHQRWNTYQSFTEDGVGFMLTGANRQAALLPKRIMSPEQIDAVRSLLEVAIHPAFGFPVQPQVNDAESANEKVDFKTNET